MTELILSIVNEGLKLFNTEESKSLANRVLNLRRSFDAEISKGDKRDDAYLDELDRELLDIGALFLTELKSKTSENKP